MATWKDHKERIDMLAVLTHKDMGYKLDPSKGKVTPCYILTDDRGNETDRLYVKNVGSIGKQRYWRRTVSQTGGGGDVIQLIEENLDRFAMTAGARNKWEAMDRVLSYFSNMPEEDRLKYQEEKQQAQVGVASKFELDRYKRYPEDNSVFRLLLAERGMNGKTAELFRPSVVILRDLKSKYNFRNLGFPYTLAGTPYNPEKPEEIKGYEIRCREKSKLTKLKAAGTNSTTACWQAYLGKTPGAPVNEIHFAEGAYDIMAYVQINRNEQNFDNTLYVSLGGSFTDKIVKQILAAYPNAKPVLHFDNDLNGHLYDCKFAATMCGKEMTCRMEGDNLFFNVDERAFMIPIEGFSYNKFREGSGLRPKLKVEKAPARFKDWNEILQNAMKLQPKAEKKMANAVMNAKYADRTGAAGKEIPKEDGTALEEEEENGRPRGRGL